MSREDDTLETALRQAIQSVAIQKGEALAQAIALVIFANLDRGRVHYFLDRQSEARKQVVLLRYFESYTFQQIALKLDKSDNAIYKLHFDALNNLRKIWESSQDIYE